MGSEDSGRLKRASYGRYILRLSFRQSALGYEDFLQQALTRFEHLEAKFCRIPKLPHEYKAFMEEYEELGHMTPLMSVPEYQAAGTVETSDAQKPTVVPMYIIPHHTVLYETSSSTKVHVVFNDSAKTANGVSLNDVLSTGHKLQKDLPEIIFNFCDSPVVFSADSCKMYHQILIHKENHIHQCILLRHSYGEDIQIYQLNRVTYRLASPYQAIRTVLHHDIFVDDIVSGAASLEAAQVLVVELVSLFPLGGFELLKWSLNNPGLQDSVPVEQREVLRSFDGHFSPGLKERLKALYHLVHKIEEERVRSEHNLNNITKAHEKINQEEKVSLYYQHKLKSLYTAAVSDAAQEEELIRTALQKVSEIRAIRNERRIQARNAGNKETIRRGALMKMLHNSAQTLPLFVSKLGEKPPPLCGAIPAEPTYIAKVGDMVAALVKSADEEENWILAEVVQFNPATNKYEVDDIDEQKDRHVLSRRRVVPLPLMKANPETDANALFDKGSVVMALYPQTTCFYKAIVNQLPASATDEYEVLFEDASYAAGYSPPLPVAQRYVISIKEKKGKSQS
ncbi:hypothetical protein PR048_021724 [Dryococelus australis]|uniref:SGF29 C-terminal domain-containing protein n=1 Tax=Dryococelus australis TaxID=614101 RepID=A0ABQ9GZ21_9NEOP|nr:hypothetical protein PR048_021724 [Dryococelus australis]